MSKIIVMDRLDDLEQSTNLTLTEMLGLYASHALDCDDCLIKRKCQNKSERRSCATMWVDYLEGTIK